jgi:large subunit ribosomal protein LP2
MRHLATYLLLKLGGNDSPSASDVSTALSAVGVEADEARLSTLLKELEGKDVDTLIKEGSKLLASFGGGGGGAAAAAAPAAAAAGAGEKKEKKEEKKEEEADLGGGMDMFGVSEWRKEGGRERGRKGAREGGERQMSCARLMRRITPEREDAESASYLGVCCDRACLPHLSLSFPLPHFTTNRAAATATKPALCPYCQDQTGRGRIGIQSPPSSSPPIMLRRPAFLRPSSSTALFFGKEAPAPASFSLSLPPFSLFFSPLSYKLG